jgi:hypothetical protein
MILLFTVEGDPHLPPIAQRLAAQGAAFRVVDPGEFPAHGELRVAYGDAGLERCELRMRDDVIDLRAVTAVWNRRPAPPAADARLREAHRKVVESASEAALGGAWSLMECLWLPGPPHALERTEFKMTQLAVAARLGLAIPRTVIANSPDEALEMYERTGGRMIAKPLTRGAVPGRDGEDRLAYTRLVRRRDLKDLHTLRWSPVILQEYVPKHVELRVTVVGSEIFPAEIESQASSRSRDDWRRYDLARTPYRRHTLPADVAERLHAVVRAFGLCYGAIDLVLTPDGRYVFLEINGNGQWLWIEELTQMPIADAIASLLARRREATPVALPATDNWTDALRGGHAPDVLARV